MEWNTLVIDLVIILILIGGIWQFRYPQRARRGNLTAVLALAVAVAAVLLRHRILEPEIVIAALVLGSLCGIVLAVKVSMIQIPAMIAFQHGAGGVAVLLVSLIELTRSVPLTTLGEISGMLGLVIGTATFSGSMIASGKLANLIRQPPVVLPRHGWIMIGLLAATLVAGFVAGNTADTRPTALLLVMVALSILTGLFFSIRIGGADMPVLISFLNATAGLAAAFCGVTIQNRLLIACGATVAASGSVLTHIMCKAMNRNLLKVFMGFQEEGGRHAKLSDGQIGQEAGRFPSPAGPTAPSHPPQDRNEIVKEAIGELARAKKVIIVPGYGMALGQAQFQVVELAGFLEQSGAEVRFGIHPVAGRMPGHMNVLLAEADISYDKLVEMEQINPQFKDADVALIVGACDVVNPAAIHSKDTPISGMPIMMAQEANKVIVCNLDERPGYSGVENLLYRYEKTLMLLGDAKETLQTLIDGLNSSP